MPSTLFPVTYPLVCPFCSARQEAYVRQWPQWEAVRHPGTEVLVWACPACARDHRAPSNPDLAPTSLVKA